MTEKALVVSCGGTSPHKQNLLYSVFTDTNMKCSTSDTNDKWTDVHVLYVQFKCFTHNSGSDLGSSPGSLSGSRYQP